MTHQSFSRREGEIMDIVYRLGRASASEIKESMTSPPSYSSVRTLLSILEQKGHLSHDIQGNRYVYRPTVPRGTARRSALAHLLETFFDDSPSQVVTALLEDRGSELSEGELQQLAQLIDKARSEGR